MHPDSQRRLESKLNEDAYTCWTFWQELPYVVWNTCPLCVCGLLPVLVVCLSAICRLDYATNVTDIGAQLINEIGGSYTVYYTAGCWPTHEAEAEGLGAGSQFRSHVQPCNEAAFEIAAGEFDAISGSLLRERNITELKARRIVAVKVTPDWRFVTFIGSLVEDVGNLYAVDAQEKKAKQAVPLLRSTQLEAIQAECNLHSDSVIETAQSASSSSESISSEPATLAGFKHLQVILPGVAPLEFGGNFANLPMPTKGSSLTYRAAFSFICKQPTGGGKVIEFSKIAIVDFSLHDMDVEDPAQPGKHFTWARSELHLLNTRPKPPTGANEYAQEAATRFMSQSCPRFVPSKQGSRLLFVAEDVAPAKNPPLNSAWHPPTVLPARLLASAELPASRRLSDSQEGSLDLGNAIESESVLQTPVREAVAAVEATDEAQGKYASKSYTGKVREPTQEQKDAKAAAAQKQALKAQQQDQSAIAAGAKVLEADSQLLDVARPDRSSLPFAPVSGCPEFVPGLHNNAKGLAESFEADLFSTPAEKAAAAAELQRFRDSFVVLSDPSSDSVLGVDAQVLAGSLPPGPVTGEVIGVKLLYNVKSSHGVGEDRLVIAGCKPIRAAGRTGHMALQSALQKIIKTLRLDIQQSEYTAWLACLTSDQRVAIVESPNNRQWINMSMPFPVWTGKKNQAVWCPQEHQESCFEVWSNPNPNE
mmetsp:Transcript_753/g.1368  ORF Transcript_753/g.1368 Transcript_753/m.1368 type:complete len:704 (-) Transcript_753:25-2136(-)